MSNLIRLPTSEQQQLLEQIQVHRLNAEQRQRAQEFLQAHHYLGGIQAVGEQMYYGAFDPQARWAAVLVFCAAAKHLRHRDAWIGWKPEQLRRRLALVANNARFLILPDWEIPNLASRVMRLTLDRLSADWEAHYAHPLLVVESFVDPQRFRGTAYRASGWKELGPTAGFARCARDYYVAHHEPKALFVRELRPDARRLLGAETLPANLAVVEVKVGPRCTQNAQQLRSLVAFFRRLPDYRVRYENYPLAALLAIIACAHFCGAPRGPKDLARFARKLTLAQRRALGIRRDRSGAYPAPSQPTFSRALRGVDPQRLETQILAFQAQLRGPPPKSDLVAFDGKEPKHSGGLQILSAVTLPSQHYLASRPVAEKTNEIPVAQALIADLDLEGRTVAMDALHTQTQTARLLVQEAGADYLFTVKDNQKSVRQSIQTLATATPAAFSPSALAEQLRANPGNQS